MNVINRIALTLICLILIAGSIAVIGLAWAEPQGSIDWLRDATGWLDDHNSDGTKIIITAAAAALALVAFIVLLMELVPKNGGEVKVTGLQVGDAVLTTAAIGQRVEEAVNQVPTVSDVRANVQARRKGVIVSLDLHVDPDANLAEVTDAACEAAREVLTEKVHVALLAPPRARLHYRELRLKGRPGRAVPVARSNEVAAPAPLYDGPSGNGGPVDVEPSPTPTYEGEAADEGLMKADAPVAVAEEEKPVKA